VASKLFKHCIIRLEEKYLRISMLDCCTKSWRLCPRVFVATLFTTKRADTSVLIIPNSICITLTVDICVQYGGHGSLHHAGLSAECVDCAVRKLGPRRWGSTYWQRSESLYFQNLAECWNLLIVSVISCIHTWSVRYYYGHSLCVSESVNHLFLSDHFCQCL